MNTELYPPISEWSVPAKVCAATLAGVRPVGTLRCESGAFWLGRRSTRARIEAVVLPLGVGVEQHCYRWRISPEVFGVVSRWAKPLGLTLLAVVHTHLPGVPVELSWIDRTQGVQVPGMLAIVIGNGGLDTAHTDWGWFLYEKSDYRRIMVSELSKRIHITNESTAGVYVADSVGVRPLSE